MKGISIIVLLIAIINCIYGRDLASNVEDRCKNGCLWTDASIWDGGVPGSGDDVVFDRKGDYEIQINSDVTIRSFKIGTDNSKNDDPTLKVLAGGSLTINQDVQSYLSSTVVVDAGGSLVATDRSQFQGEFIVAGVARFRGSNPSLKINTKAQIPGLTVYGKLNLYTNGNVIVNNELEIDSNTFFFGNGTIQGDVEMKGTMQPGGDGTIGQITITGKLDIGGAAAVDIDVSNKESFDKITVLGKNEQSGTVWVKLSSGYEPNQSDEFTVFVHDSRSGEYKVLPDGIKNLFSKAWKPITDSKSTILHYNSASALLISIPAILFCFLVTFL